MARFERKPKPRRDQRENPTPVTSSPFVWILNVPGAGASQHAASAVGGEDAQPASVELNNSMAINRIMATI
jgi:hypothetical protein